MVAARRPPLCGEHSQIRLDPGAAPDTRRGVALGAEPADAEALSDARLREARIYVRHLAQDRP